MARKKRTDREKSKKTGAGSNSGAWSWWHALLIIVATVFVYGRSLDNGFTNWDDGEYIVNNPDLSDASLRKHFIERPEVMGNFHPVTMLTLSWSHAQALDPRTGRLDPTVFHTTDLLIHVLSSLLVYVVILLLSRLNWVALFTSLLFAVHPMHVESVAWVSERKDVLYVFFTLLAIACYIGHLRSRTPWWLIGCSVLFVLAVLSKAMAVSLVPVLFLIDFHQSRKWSWRIILEKLPCIAIAVWAGLRAVAAQRAFASVQDLDVYPLAQRLLFASYGLMEYTVKLFVPHDLSAFHAFPMPLAPLPWSYLIAPVFVVFIVLALWKWRKNRDLVFGALFFLVTVVLVLQLLPVGGAVIAERYTYLPYVGSGFAVISAIHAWMTGSPSRRMPATIGTAVFVAGLALFAQQRTRVWRDGSALWADAFAKDPKAPKILNNFGVELTEAKRYTEALAKLDAAIVQKHDYAEAFYNRGRARYYLGQQVEAIADYDEAIRINPTLAIAWYNRSGSWYAIHQPEKALVDALRAQELGYPVDPKFIEVLRQQAAMRTPPH